MNTEATPPEALAAPPRARPATLGPALAASLALIAVQAFEWNLMDLLTPFLAPLVALPVFLLFVVVGFATLVEAIAGLWKRQFYRLMPLGVCVAALVAAVEVPWTRVMLDVDFQLHRGAREEVVRQIQQGRLRPDPRFGTGLIKLPLRYRNLSAGGGEVVYEGGEVLFYTFRGVLDSFAGFVYSPSDTAPGFASFGGDLKEVRRLRKYWYWMSSS